MGLDSFPVIAFHCYKQHFNLPTAAWEPTFVIYSALFPMFEVVMSGEILPFAVNSIFSCLCLMLHGVEPNSLGPTLGKTIILSVFCIREKQSCPWISPGSVPFPGKPHMLPLHFQTACWRRLNKRHGGRLASLLLHQLLASWSVSLTTGT